jgi:hypothetical protein
MVDRSRKPRKPHDTNQLAKLITDLATGQASDASRPQIRKAKGLPLWHLVVAAV